MYRALNYVMIDEDLYKRGVNGVLLKFVGKGSLRSQVKFMKDFVVLTWKTLQ